MKKEINELIKKFNEIKKRDYIESLRGWTTGIGYTFETLLGKKEDSLPEPDYKGIEIKTKLGYSKSPITLFNLVPSSKEKNTIKFLVTKYGYHKKAEPNLKAFRIETTTLITKKAKYTNYKLELNKRKGILILNMYNKDNTKIKDSVYWDLYDIYIRLVTKVSLLALVTAYDYNINNKKYYKYTSINFYSLKSFDAFLDLLENGKIIISFNAEEKIDPKDNILRICDRGTSFRIKKEDLSLLYNKVI